MKRILNYIAHVIDIAVVLKKSDAAYIVVTKNKDGLIEIEEQGQLFLNRSLGEIESDI